MESMIGTRFHSSLMKPLNTERKSGTHQKKWETLSRKYNWYSEI